MGSKKPLQKKAILQVTDRSIVSAVWDEEMAVMPKLLNSSSNAARVKRGKNLYSDKNISAQVKIYLN